MSICSPASTSSRRASSFALSWVAVSRRFIDQPVFCLCRACQRSDGYYMSFRLCLERSRQLSHAGKQFFADDVRLFQVRVAGEDEGVEAEGCVFADALGHLVVAADQRGASAAAHEPDA